MRESRLLSQRSPVVIRHGDEAAEFGRQRRFTGGTYTYPSGTRSS